MGACQPTTDAAGTPQEIALNARSERPLSLTFLGDPNSVHTRRWLTYFAGRGHRVHLLVPDGQTVEPGLDPRIQVGAFIAYPPTRVRGYGSLITRRSIRRAISDARPEILHAHSLTRYGWMAQLSGFRPYVITVWGTDVFRAHRSPWWTRRRSRIALRDAALVTAVSRALADEAVALGAHGERIRIVQFGVDPDRFTPGPAPAGLRERIGATGRRVLFAPRAIRPLYRQEVVVASLPRLPDDVLAVFSEGGQDPAYRDRLEADATALGVAGRVRFVPAIPHTEMPDHYRLADVVVSVPESDAFPVTALEAMACGVPIVLSDLPSTREGIEDVDPGAIVPVGDVEATAAAIRARLDLAPDVRAELASRLRAAALERGDMKSNLLRMEDEYRRLSGHP